MPFYLRKSLSFGPVRFNLSKSGVGVSAGVTGARVGLNKKGAYFHGGRHGLYYRTKLGKKKKRGRKSEGSSAASPGTVELFVDTGETYTDGTAGLAEKTPPRESQEPDTKSLAYPFYFMALGLALAGMISGSGAALLIALAAALSGPLYRKRKQAFGERRLQELDNELETLGEESRPVKTLGELRERPIPKAFTEARDERIAEAALLLYIDSNPEFNKAALQALLAELEVSEERIMALKKELFEDLLDAFIADHIISEEEEQTLEQLIRDFGLQDEDIAPQRHLMRQLIRLRQGIESGFEPVECPLKLTRNEECFYATEGKLLKQRVLDTFQRNSVRYKQIGYETDKAGMIYLTNKQIYIVDSGVRSIRLNTILDITCSLEDNTLHLSLNNRVNPVILSVPETTVFAARLNYFSEQA